MTYRRACSETAERKFVAESPAQVGRQGRHRMNSNRAPRFRMHGLAGRAGVP